MVDSLFVLDLLKRRASLEKFRKAFQLATIVDLDSVRGWLFDELVHHWFEETKPVPMLISWGAPLRERDICRPWGNILGLRTQDKERVAGDVAACGSGLHGTRVVRNAHPW